MFRLLVICHCLFVLEIRPPRNYLSFHVGTDISVVYAIMCISNVGIPVHVRVLCMGANSLQSYPVLCNPMDHIPLGPSVHGILQQNYWNGLPCATLGHLPNLGTEPTSLMSPAFAGRFFTTSTTWEAHYID